jgi:hypothetical protein
MENACNQSTAIQLKDLWRGIVPVVSANCYRNYLFFTVLLLRLLVLRLLVLQLLVLRLLDATSISLLWIYNVNTSLKWFPCSHHLI